MPVHELPHDSQDQFFVAVEYVNSANTDQRKLHLLSDHDSVVAIGHFFELIFRVEVDLAPRNDARLHLILNSEQGYAVAQVFVEVVHIPNRAGRFCENADEQ